MGKSVTSEVLKVTNVRLSFPRLDTPKAFQPGQDPRFEATALLDPANAEHKQQIETVKAVAKKIAEEHFGVGKVPKDIKMPWKNGDEKEYDGYAGMWVLPMHNKVRPSVKNRKGESVAAGDEAFPYAGCYVNISFTLWVQDNQYGKRINVNLRSVQFVRDGEAFGIANNSDEDFEALGDEGGAAEKGMWD